MAKKGNNNDETPIQFYVPGVGSGRNKTPVPINQPNWKYLKEGSLKPKPTVVLLYIISGLVLLAFAFLIIISGFRDAVQNKDWISIAGFIIVVLILIVIGTINIITPINQIRNYKKN